MGPKHLRPLNPGPLWTTSVSPKIFEALPGLQISTNVFNFYIFVNYPKTKLSKNNPYSELLKMGSGFPKIICAKFVQKKNDGVY